MTDSNHVKTTTEFDIFSLRTITRCGRVKIQLLRSLCMIMSSLPQYKNRYKIKFKNQPEMSWLLIILFENLWLPNICTIRIPFTYIQKYILSYVCREMEHKLRIHQTLRLVLAVDSSDFMMISVNNEERKLMGALH